VWLTSCLVTPIRLTAFTHKIRSPISEKNVCVWRVIMCQSELVLWLARTVFPDWVEWVKIMIVVTATMTTNHRVLSIGVAGLVLINQHERWLANDSREWGSSAKKTDTEWMYLDGNKWVMIVYQLIFDHPQKPRHLDWVFWRRFRQALPHPGNINSTCGWDAYPGT
jgi:hypothetical protein